MTYPSEFPRFCICIPTLNRWDLLQGALTVYTRTFPDISIYVLDNGNQARNVIAPNIMYLDPGPNNGVSASWNRLLSRAFAFFPYALVLNDDIVLQAAQYDIGNLLHFQKPVFARHVNDWCAFVISKKCFEKTGAFDEKIRAYYGDNDYEYRMKLLRIKQETWIQLAPAVYRQNSSSEKMPEIRDWAYADRDYFVKKWGGLPGKEKFKAPFDGVL